MMIETVIYGFKREKVSAVELATAELLSISVDESVRGKGVGKRLVHELEMFYKKHGVAKYKVVTFSKDEKANRFYLACNFTFYREFKHHGNTMNEYIKELV
jgi:ribosomal protein S18 acetylase RimI-like enzyme